MYDFFQKHCTQAWLLPVKKDLPVLLLLRFYVDEHETKDAYKLKLVFEKQKKQAGQCLREGLANMGFHDQINTDNKVKSL